MDGKLTDLIQQDRAAVGHLKKAHLSFYGAGKGAFFIAEKLGLQQVFRNCRAVHRNEGRILPLALVVDLLGDDLLADAAFTGDQHAGIRFGDHGYEPAQLHHVLGVAHQVGRCLGIPQVLQFLLNAAVFLHRLVQLVPPCGGKGEVLDLRQYKDDLLLVVKNGLAAHQYKATVRHLGNRRHLPTLLDGLQTGRHRTGRFHIVIGGAAQILP